MLIQNAIKITENPTEEIFLISSHVHDFRSYQFKDGTFIFVDGGNDYIRRGGSSLRDNSNWVDWSLDDEDEFSTIKERLLWGTRGKDGNQPLKYVRLVKCETDHLKAILDYSKSVPISPLYRNVIVSILGDREIPKKVKKAKKVKKTT